MRNELNRRTGYGLRIERMRAGHLAEILEIERASFSTPWSENSFMSEVENPDSGSYVALNDSTVAGYICTRRAGLAGAEGHILNLAVRPEFRRKGIAKVLVREGLEWLKAQGCIYVYLEVRASNLPARRLYEGLGFRAAGIRKSYYVLPLEDALVMMTELRARAL